MALPITRSDLDAAGLRQAAARSSDANAARRMLALALVLEGHGRGEAARQCGMDRQTRRDWVHRYNELGLAGLSDRKAPGPAPRLTAEQQAELAELVQKGPDLAEHGVVRWRRIDLARLIESRFGVRLAERSVGGLLRRLGFRRLSVRPRHTGQDAAAQEAHKKFASLVAAALPEHAKGKPIELWWQDEARVGQHGTLTRVWARRGSRPPAPRDCRYAFAYLFGAVCPARGTGAALVLPRVNAQAMNLHLAEISHCVSAGAHAMVVLDGAGWHQLGNKLKLPHNLSLLPLPPYSPEP